MLPNSSDQNVYPLIKFVPAGHPVSSSATLPYDFLNIYHILPCTPLCYDDYKTLYARGVQIVEKMGWKRGMTLGLSGSLHEPLQSVRAYHHRFTLCCRPLSRTPYVILAPDQEVNVTQNSVPFRLLPHITIVSCKQELLALVDTGCEVTCINEEYYCKLKQMCHFPVLPVASTQLRGAMGQLSSRIRLQIWLNFRIADTDCSFTHTFLVVKNLVRPVILGIDWLNSVGAKLDLVEHCISLVCDEKPAKIPFNLNTRCVLGPDLGNSDIAINAFTNNVENSSDDSIKPLDLSLYVNSLEELRTKVDCLGVLSLEQRSIFISLLSQFQTVFNKLPGKTNKYVHTIRMSDTTPFIKRSYPIPFSLRVPVERLIREMLELGVIKREPSPYASPVTVVKKKDGSVRICLDARFLNSKMLPDHEAPTPPEEIFQSFSEIKYMSTIDLRASYWQIPLDPSSTQYTAFLYGGKTYTYQVLPFGLKTAVASFTRAMDIILGPEVQEFTFKYIDDLLVVSDSFENHVLHLSLLFTKLRDAGLTVNLEKTQFLKQQVKFLGHILTTRGVMPDIEKTTAIRNFPVPKTTKHLRAFLGLCNYYRRFSQHYSNAIVPLTHLLSKNCKWKWGEAEQRAFELTKSLFLDSVILHFPDFRKTFYLQTDGSGVALGVELYQIDDIGEHRVLGFASRILRGPELLYTVTEKELLAIIFGLKKYRMLILGHKVVIRTDHYALKFLRQCRLLNDRLTRWTMYLNEFDYEVEHVPGSQNVVADTLSRYPPELGDTSVFTGRSPVVVPVTSEYLVNFFEATDIVELRRLLKDLPRHQGADLYCRSVILRLDVLPSPKTNVSNFAKYFKMHQNLLVYQKENDLQPRLVIPEQLVNVVVNCYHEQYGHFGISKLHTVLKRNLYFRKMRKTIHHLIRACDTCQKSKYPSRKLIGTTHPIIASRPGELVTVDYYGPLPEGRSRVSYIFVVIDAFSKYVRLYPLRRAQSKISALKIINDFSRSIKVDTILSDHGSQFTSQIWQNLLKRHGIRPTFSSIRHPGSNPTERVMKELGRLFRTYCSNSHCSWSTHIGKIETLFNNTPHLSTGYSPMEVLYGRNTTNPLDDAILPYLPPPPAKSVQQIREEVRVRLRDSANQRIKHSRARNDKLKIDDLVLLRTNPVSDAANKILYKFCPLFSGPYKISNNPFPNVYTLTDPVTNEKKGNFNITNLKYYYCS